MKLKIGDYEVTVTAKGSYTRDTKTFLNTLSSALADCADARLKNGLPATAYEVRKMSNDIYDFLDSKGYYDFK